MRKNSKFFCKATIYTEDDGTQKFVKFGNSHTHERNLGSYERQKIANKVKNFASESSEKASKIHKKLKSQLDREEVKIAGSDGAVRRKIQRCKGKIKRISWQKCLIKSRYFSKVDFVVVWIRNKTKSRGHNHSLTQADLVNAFCSRKVAVYDVWWSHWGVIYLKNYKILVQKQRNYCNRSIMCVEMIPMLLRLSSDELSATTARNASMLMRRSSFHASIGNRWMLLFFKTSSALKTAVSKSPPRMLAAARSISLIEVLLIILLI